MIKQLKTNKILRKALETKESRIALINAMLLCLKNSRKINKVH